MSALCLTQSSLTLASLHDEQPCTRGEFCSLGRDQSEGYDALLCPGGTMCPNASVPVPINCTTPDTKCIMKLCPKNQSCVQECRGMYSCPNGTVQEQLCPAGKTCHTPLSAGRLCPKTSFCPNGTFAAPPPCPPKFFCPTPSEKLPCPEGHFCPGGTLSPLKCAVMDFCPAFSSKKRTGVFYLVIVFALPFLCCGGLKWAYKLRDSNRTKRDRRKELKRLSSLRGSLSRSQVRGLRIVTEKKILRPHSDT